MKKKRIAIVHDALLTLGGAEKVFVALAELFPQADLFTSLAEKKVVEDLNKQLKRPIHFSLISHWKLVKKWPSLLKPYIYHYYWPKLNLDAYDLVICSAGSYNAHWVKVKKEKVVYLHSPAKFLYTEYNEMNWLKTIPWNCLFWPYFSLLRKKGRQEIRKTDVLLTNSEIVKKRIWKYFLRQATVVYPPIKSIETRAVNFSQGKNEPYYLFFSRLVKQKGIDLAIETFSKNGLTLKVIGTGPKLSTWQKKSPTNIHFYGYLAEKAKAQVIARALALIYPSQDEDFGLIPLEVIGYGVPIIAYQKMTKLETLDGGSAVFFSDYSVSGLNLAIKKLNRQKRLKIITQQNCIKQAKLWQKQNFAQDFFKNINRLQFFSKNSNQ